MTQRPPAPICRAFVICRRIVREPQTLESSLLAVCSSFEYHNFPAATNAGIFGRLTSAHGDYLFEVQLQNADGDVVWKDGPPGPISMPDPLRKHDLMLNLCMVFPEPGTFDVVLLANGEELARDRFYVSRRSFNGGEMNQVVG